MKAMNFSSPEIEKEVIRKVELFDKYSKKIADLKSVNAIKQHLVFFITEYNGL